MYQADGGNISNGSFVSFPVEMRANPTISFTNVAATKTNSSYANGVGKGGFYFQVNVTSTGTHSREDTITADAEL